MGKKDLVREREVRLRWSKKMYGTVTFRCLRVSKGKIYLNE